MNKGAQLTETVRSLFKQAGILGNKGAAQGEEEKG